MMEIDGNRLLERLEALASVGARPDGGVSRLAFSETDRQGRDFIGHHLKRLGLVPSIDAIGNLWAVRPGTQDTEPVFMGSHTDSVDAGGRYDGALGVLAALEVLETLHEHGVRTRKPLGLVSFVNEEGVRFMPDMMGSLYLRGSLSTKEIRGTRGTDGTTIGENLDRHVMAGPDDLRGTPISAFVEVHIEQGPVLEDLGLPVGVVSGVQGLRWLEIRIEGSANHAGTTPMSGRRDPMPVAARLIRAARELSERTPDLRTTVGHLVVQPNLVNVIPQSVTLTVDLRHPETDVLGQADAEIRHTAAMLAAEASLDLSVRELAATLPVRFDDAVVGAISTGVERCGQPVHHLISGAGHDAQILAPHCPSGMIFIRSRDGVSHSPREYSSPEDVVLGAQVLLESALLLAGTQ